jgi:hypothetical protein
MKILDIPPLLISMKQQKPAHGNGTKVLIGEGPAADQYSFAD